MRPIPANLDELVFEGRNKVYGAYRLRKEYERTTLFSFFIAMCVLLTAAISPRLFSSDEVKIDDFKGTEVKLEEWRVEEKKKEEIVEPVVNRTPPPIVRTFVIPTQVEADCPENQNTTIPNLDTATGTVGNTNSTGETTGTGEPNFNNNNCMCETEETVEVEPDADGGFVLLEQEPIAVNMNELKRLIQYPVEAKEARLKGKVTVRVLVDKEGNYVKHKILKTPHDILTQAVERHLKIIKFTPGIQNGKPIKVWVTIPFDFTLN